MLAGTILRIEKISPYDGQGLRTVVFFKGCPLRCAWCSTPESQSAQPEWFYKQAKCLHCGRCLQSCPHGALSVSADRTAVVRDRDKCVRCFQCAAVCPAHAIGVYGQTMTVDEVMQQVRAERLFYFCSGGGVTLSGGDVLLQADFARAILEECRADCIDTAAELDLYGPYENVRKVVELLDSYFVDVKLMDPGAHTRWTGRSNETILRNLRAVSREFPDTPLTVRVPLIPGVNDTPENLADTAMLCRSLPSCRALEILPYHRLGAATYDYLAREYPLGDLPRLSTEEAQEKIAFLLAARHPFEIRVAGR